MSKNAPIYIGNRQLLDVQAIAELSASLIQQMLSAFTGGMTGASGEMEISKYGYTPLNQNGEIDSKYINLTVSDTDTPIVTHTNKINFSGDFIRVKQGETGEAIVQLNLPVENPDYSVLKNTSFEQIYDKVDMILPIAPDLYDSPWTAGEVRPGINDYVDVTDTAISTEQKYTMFTLKSSIPLYIPSNNTYFLIEIKNGKNGANNIIAETGIFNVKNARTLIQSVNLISDDGQIIPTLDYDNITCVITDIKQLDNGYSVNIELKFNLSRLIGKAANLQGGQFQVVVTHIEKIDSVIDSSSTSKQLGKFISNKIYLNCGSIPYFTGGIQLTINNESFMYSSGIKYITGGVLNISLPTVHNLYANASVKDKVFVNTNLSNEQLVLQLNNINYFNASETPILSSIIIPTPVYTQQIVVSATAKNAYGSSQQKVFTYELTKENGIDGIFNTALVDKINNGFISNGTNEYFVNENYRYSWDSKPAQSWNSNAPLRPWSLKVIPGVGLCRQENERTQGYYRLFKSENNLPKLGGTFVFEGITKKEFDALNLVEIAVAHEEDSSRPYTWYSLQKYWNNNISIQRREINSILNAINNVNGGTIVTENNCDCNCNNDYVDNNPNNKNFAGLSAQELEDLKTSLETRLTELDNLKLGVKTNVIEQDNKLYVSFILFGDDDNTGTLTSNFNNSNEYIAAGEYGIYLKIVMDTNTTATISYIGLKNTTTMEEW